ncbi:Protein LDOC1, partial [Zancudomyces culisetae]
MMVHQLDEIAKLAMQQALQESQAQAQAQAQTPAQVPSQLQNLPAANPQPRIDGIRIPEIQKYSGESGRFRAFTAEIKRQFWARPDVFQSDHNKIWFISSHLAGHAALWFDNLIDTQSPLLSDFKGFENEFQKRFSDPGHQARAITQLHSCRQS